MKYSKTTIPSLLTLGFCVLMTLVTSSFVAAQSYDGLLKLEGFNTNVYYSDGAERQAIIMATRNDKVMAYFSQHLDFEPTVTLLVLSPDDWSNHTGFPFYGMPHYFNETLVVASEDNDFWRSFIPQLDQLSDELAQQVVDTYILDGSLSMRGFFDLLAVHELAHAYHLQGGLNMQRLWMGELFSNILLHTYIAENEPERLPALTVFPEMG